MPLDTLTYEIRWLDPAFKMDPPRMELVLDDFDCVVEGDTLTARPRVPFADAADARRALEPLLRAWELELELERGYRPDFRLSSSSASEVREDGTKAIQVGLHEYLGLSESISVTVGAAIPLPTRRYVEGPVTTRYLTRLREMRAGKDKVPGAVYAILTDIEHRYGGRKAASTALAVSSTLLGEIGKRTAGFHNTDWRKSARGGVTLTSADLAWLARAATLLVRRAAEVESGARALPLLDTGDV